MKNTLNDQIAAAINHLRKEIDTVRTGRANPALVESLNVECYGGQTPLQQIASINSPEPKMLVVQPWDPGLIKDIEKAISQSSLGIMPVVDGNLIRLPFPSMTEERRKQLTKVVHEKAEEARISIRNIREEAMKEQKRQETAGETSEDTAEIERENIQKSVNQANEEIAQMAAQKEQEIMTV